MLRLGKRPWWIDLEWDSRDLWVGAYWCWKVARYGTQYGLVKWDLHLYLCLLPCLPLHVVIGRPQRERPTSEGWEDQEETYAT